MYQRTCYEISEDGVCAVLAVIAVAALGSKRRYFNQGRSWGRFSVKCTYTLHLYTVCIQCVYTTYVQDVCIQLMYTMYVCMYTMYIYIYIKRNTISNERAVTN